MKNPKKLIIDEYRERGSPISLEDLQSKLGNSLFKTICRLPKKYQLDSVLGLTLDQADELIKFYGNGFLFTPEIEKNVREYIATRKKLTFIEDDKQS